jgi:uncharacterized protein YdaU (DUF1376 family)
MSDRTMPPGQGDGKAVPDGEKIHLPYMPLYVADLLSSPKVQGMTTEQIGAYMLILMACWYSDEKKIRGDDQTLGQVTRLGTRWKKVKGPVVDCLSVDGDFVTNAKLKQVWSDAVATYEEKRRLAQKAAQARWGKGKSDADAYADAYAHALPTHMPEQCPSNAISNIKYQTLPLEEEEPPTPLAETDESVEGSLTAHQVVVTEWNASAPVRCSRLTAARRRALSARLRDAWWRENYREGLARLPNARFLWGENDRRWKADFDWFIKPDSLARILEGKYDHAAATPQRTGGPVVGPGDRHDSSRPLSAEDFAR